MAIENDKVVAMNYTLKDTKTNEVLDTNEGGEPIEFMVGRGHIIPGLEEEIIKLNDGDKKEITVSSDKAYGVYDESKLQTLPKEQFAGIELSEGMTLFGQGEDGGQVQVIVKSFNDEEVTIDFNHPLAGKDLLFDIEIASIRDASEDELATGAIGGGCCGDHSGGCCGEHTSHEEEGCCGGHHHNHEHGSCSGH